VSEWRNLDRASLLVEVDAETGVFACERALRREGLTLGLEGGTASLPPEIGTIGAWLAHGAPGARDPWADPADHLVAGLTATLANGEVLSIRPSPRRAVGPDLIALVVGMEERYARIDRAWLRVHRLDASEPRVHPFVAERNPPLSAGEKELLAAIGRALD
jgi:alkyldihydroxyacetonephosphate synthase